METRDTDAADILVGALRSLGGPVYAAEDVAWASAMPQGRELLEWLALQVECGEGPREILHREDSLKYWFALGPITLHGRELRELSSATNQLTNASYPDDTVARSAEYMGPATLSAGIRVTEEEAELLEDETTLLRCRVSRSKVAARCLTQTIKALRVEVEENNEELSRQDANLSELCINADTILSRSARTAEKLLDRTKTETRVADCRTDQSKILSLQLILASLTRLHGVIASSATLQFESVDEAAALLPAPAEVKREAARLYDALHTLRGRWGRVNGSADTRHLPADIYGDREADIKTELMRAWFMDQQVLLEARESIVNLTSECLRDELFPALDAIHSALAERSQCILEEEALVSVLIEELEEIADDVTSVNVRKQAGQASASTGADGHAQKKHAHEMLEDELTELLKRTQSLRPRDARPLVLLEREDVAKELEAIHLLSIMYDNAPVNTSPPFGLLPGTGSLEQSVKQTTDHLNTMIQRLQKATQFSDRDKRKFTAFVEKWAR
ncbi:hypothetical protein DAEQUDRAFT_245887 [Daedalea quercina L-15889]|uniref:Uncharacterized protein n=1 Tax=Daedalea quercina L-15889 TaxID=1314783 RepID=A0A165QLJ3_9APHY|nr:hypothetical protein DAEQUDRAFT_245887 [Daedalea quercina L-15889]